MPANRLKSGYEGSLPADASMPAGWTVKTLAVATTARSYSPCPAVQAADRPLARGSAMPFTHEDLLELGDIIARAQRPGVKAALQDLVRSQHEVGKSGETCASKRWRQHDLGGEKHLPGGGHAWWPQGSFCTA